MTGIVERYTEADLDQLRAHYLAELDKKDDEIERVWALKTPATRQWLNTTKAALDSAEDEIERLREDKAAISQTASDYLHEIERLRAENQDLIVSNTTLDKSNLEMRAEIERLRAALDEERNEGELADALLLIAAWEDKANRRADEIERLRAQTDTSIKDQIIAGHIDNFMKQHTEIERLQAEAKASNDEAHRAWAMVQDLRAEIERLRLQCCEWEIRVNQRDAEIEQLRADKAAISGTASGYLHEIERLQGEV